MNLNLFWVYERRIGASVNGREMMVALDYYFDILKNFDIVVSSL